MRDRIDSEGALLLAAFYDLPDFRIDLPQGHRLAEEWAILLPDKADIGDQAPEVVGRPGQRCGVADARAQRYWGSFLGVGDNRVEEAVLGLELVIAGGSGDPGLAGDVVDARVMKAALDERIASGLDDFPTGLGNVLLGLADPLGSGRDFFATSAFSA